MLSDIDIALGFPFGGSAVALPSSTVSARSALEEVLRSALLRPPCIVTFSGGRDSSALLALATDLARREGLPEPIAVTRVHPDVPESDESEWQERVVRHLGVTGWQRVEFHDELDILGPYGLQVLQGLGQVWPPMLHTIIPFLELADGGTCITGEGGDEILGTRRGTVLQADQLRSLRPRRSTARRLLQDLAPRALRARLLGRHVDQQRPWLHTAATQELRSALLATYLDEPLVWNAAIAWERGQRKWRLSADSYGVLGRAHGVTIVHPLLDLHFLAALVANTPRFGYCCRGCAMEALFGDLLPAEVLRRRTKADFTGSIYRAATRAFVEGWDTDHPLNELVRTRELRDELLRDRPHVGTVPLLQSAWLATQASASAADQA